MIANAINITITVSIAIAISAVVVIVVVIIFVKVDINVMLGLMLLFLLIVRRRSSLGFWIGLNDLGLESSFKWSDGSPVQYTNYAFREPNDFFKQEDCIEMWLSGTWNDDHCNRRNAYICKINGMF